MEVLQLSSSSFGSGVSTLGSSGLVPGKGGAGGIEPVGRETAGGGEGEGGTAPLGSLANARGNLTEIL